MTANSLSVDAPYSGYMQALKLQLLLIYCMSIILSLPMKGGCIADGVDVTSAAV